MNKLVNKAVSHPLLIAIIGGIASHMFPEVRAWTWNTLKWLWRIFAGDYVIPGWLIAVVGLYVLCSLVILAKIAYDNMSRPPHLKYTEDMIDGIKWDWLWEGNEIKELHPYCQNCYSELLCVTIGALHTSFICTRCEESDKVMPRGIKAIRNSVTKEIRRRLRTGEAYSQNPNSTPNQPVRTEP